MEENKTKKQSKFELWLKRNLTVKVIVANASIAALYAVITILCGPLSYVGGSLQLRFSEILNLLVFFNPMYSIGLTLGCLLANIMSMYGWPDIVFGTLGTLISCILIIITNKTIKNLLLSAICPCIINAAIVPLILFFYGTEMNMFFYRTCFGRTFLGEFICVIVAGYPLFMILAKKYRGFYKMIGATSGFNFVF